MHIFVSGIWSLLRALRDGWGFVESGCRLRRCLVLMMLVLKLMTERRGGGVGRVRMVMEKWAGIGCS